MSAPLHKRAGAGVGRTGISSIGLDQGPEGGRGVESPPPSDRNPNCCVLGRRNCRRRDCWKGLMVVEVSGLGHRSDNFNEFVILLVRQHKYDVTLVSRCLTCGLGRGVVEDMGVVL